MRHSKKGFKLNRTSAHRKATLTALSTALIRHKRIETTLTKAKALRMHVEPIINRAKEDTTHNRRQAFRYLGDKYAVTELFTDVAGKIGDRPGGYTRIVKLGQRAGDSAEMAVIELVDYNDVKPDGASTGSKKKTRRAGRSRGKSTAASAAAPAVQEADEATEAAVDVTEDVVDTAAEVAEEVVEKAAEVAEDVAEAAAEVAEEVAEAATEVAEDVVEAAAEVAEDVKDAVADAPAEDDAEAADDEKASDDPDEEEKKG